jgi:deoxyhypusine synthase
MTTRRVVTASPARQVRVDATPVKVHADATLIMPLLVAQTFARERDECAEVQ